MKWKSVSPWGALAFNSCVTAWFVYQNDALTAAVLGAVSGVLFSAMISRRIWKIDDQTAIDLWIEFWGRGVGENAANARFGIWICSIACLILALFGLGREIIRVIPLIASAAFGIAALSAWQRLRRLQQ